MIPEELLLVAVDDLAATYANRIAVAEPNGHKTRRFSHVVELRQKGD